MYVCIKYNLKESALPVDQWEKMASDRSSCRKLIHESIESFENSRMQYSAYKRLIRKGEQGPASAPQSHHANCDICGKLCLSLVDLKSHLRKCAKSILHRNNVTANKTEPVVPIPWQNLLQLGWPEESRTRTYNLRRVGEVDDMR